MAESIFNNLEATSQCFYFDVYSPPNQPLIPLRPVQLLTAESLLTREGKVVPKWMPIARRQSAGLRARTVHQRTRPAQQPLKGPGSLRRHHSESRPNAFRAQKWNLNPSWKMRWGKPPVAINFLFEVVRMFVPARVGLPAASIVTAWFTPETLTMLKRLVNSPMTSTRIDSRTGMKRE